MDRNNKYYGVIEELVKNHRKFPGYEAILDDIIADVYAHSEVILKTITDENVIKAYFEKVIATSVITVPKKLGYSKPDIKNTISVEPVISNVAENSVIESSTNDANINYVKNTARIEYVDKMINSVSDDLDCQSSAIDTTSIEEQELLSHDVVENIASNETTVDDNNNLSLELEESNNEASIIAVENSADENADAIEDFELHDTEELNFSDTQSKDAETKDNSLFDDTDTISGGDSLGDNDIEVIVNNDETGIEFRDSEEQDFDIIQPLENEKDNQSDSVIDTVLEEDSLKDNEMEFGVSENDIELNAIEEQTFDDIQPLDIDETLDTQNIVPDGNLIEESKIENGSIEEVSHADEIYELNYSDDTDDLQENLIEDVDSDEIKEIDFANSFDSAEEQAGDFNAEQLDIQENLVEEDLLLQQDDNDSVDSDFILNEAETSEDLLENIDNNDIVELDTVQEALLEESDDEVYKENDSNDLHEIKQDTNLSIVNFDAFSYTPVQEIYSDNDKQDLIKDLAGLNKKYPELNIFAVYDAKYNKNMDISSISEELSMSSEAVVKALNEIVDLV